MIHRYSKPGWILKKSSFYLSLCDDISREEKEGYSGTWKIEKFFIALQYCIIMYVVFGLQ